MNHQFARLPYLYWGGIVQNNPKDDPIKVIGQLQYASGLGLNAKNIWQSASFVGTKQIKDIVYGDSIEDIKVALL